ncbi:MAG: NADH-quinone oxidoreductase subunit C [Chloroflexi bacterium]|nr:NADH-quinone oxidoreductase subunit C [Chloroflexota bacterium]
MAADLAQAWEGIAFEQRFNFSDLEVTIAPQDVLEACRRCKGDSRLSFDWLMCLSGVDCETHFEVVYHLYSYRDHRRLTIRARLEDRDNPAVASVVSVWKGADWHEREAAEMFGIDFPGHPNLTPLLLEEGVEERPLLKSQPLVPIFADRPGVVQQPEGVP